MSRKTLIYLGKYSYFVRMQIKKGKHLDETSVVKAALELFESKEKLAEFKKAIRTAVDSGIAQDSFLKTNFEFINNNCDLPISFKITNQAIIDLKTIWISVNRQKSKKMADTYIKLLIRYCNKIEESPYKPLEYNDVWKGLTGIKMRPAIGMRRVKHIIYYRINDIKEIEILRFLSENMDIKRHMHYNL